MRADLANTAQLLEHRHRPCRRFRQLLGQRCLEFFQLPGHQGQSFTFPYQALSQERRQCGAVMAYDLATFELPGKRRPNLHPTTDCTQQLANPVPGLADFLLQLPRSRIR